MSHSQVAEWISGSFIQSHWPWQMLWESSMFSMDLAAASPTVPVAQPTLVLLARMVSLAAISRTR